MEEFTVPALYEPGANAYLSDLIVRNADQAGNEVALSHRSEGTWIDITNSELLKLARASAKGLIAAGVQPGDRVAILSRTRYEWTVLDFAIWMAGAIPVPVYETSSAEQIAWILSDSGAVAVIAESPLHASRIDTVRRTTPNLQHVWNLEDAGLETIGRLGASVSDADLDARRTGLGAATIATIIYTSGTTGRPKGCVLTHGNFLFDAMNAVESMPDVFRQPGSSTLMFLPLAHVLARTIEIGAIEARIRMGYTPNSSTLPRDLLEFQPTFVLAVPRVFEKVFNSARQKATDDGSLLGIPRVRIFDQAASVAEAWSRGQERGGASLAVNAQHAVFEHLVYGKLRAAMGGRVRWAVSGGAPLGERLGHFFHGVGVTILEGYGLTETNAAMTLNRPSALRIGTVGQPIPGTTVRIAEDGEIVVKGGNIFAGYWNNDAATRDAMDSQGWFHTGDVGQLDDGFLRITGRKKELLVTAGGKNVAPAPLEDVIRAHPLVSQCIVLGDQRPYITALITLDPEALGPWLASQGRDPQTPTEDLIEDPDLLKSIRPSVDNANATVSVAESIKRFRLLADDFTEDNGLLTPSLKVRRHLVVDAYADTIDALYGQGKGQGAR